MSSWSRVSSDGSHATGTERLCANCFEAERTASDARLSEIQARLEDGSIFEEIRAELADGERTRNPTDLARVAEFLDLLDANLGLPLPADLRAFADQHRDPAA